jgi:hypothetical protein
MPDYPIGYRHWFDDELNIKLMPYHHLPSIKQTETVKKFPKPRLMYLDNFIYSSNNNTLYSKDYFSYYDNRILGIDKRTSEVV